MPQLQVLHFYHLRCGSEPLGASCKGRTALRTCCHSPGARASRALRTSSLGTHGAKAVFRSTQSASILATTLASPVANHASVTAEEGAGGVADGDQLRDFELQLNSLLPDVDFKALGDHIYRNQDVRDELMEWCRQLEELDKDLQELL